MTDGKSVNVRYYLVVIQTVDDDVDTEELVSQVEIKGALEVAEGQGMVDIAGRPFTLKLNDGRCLEAVAKKGDTVTGHWEIVAASTKGLAPC